MSNDVETSVLERRLGAVTAVRQVVHAIWALAQAQLPSVERAPKEAAVYLDWIMDVIERLAGPETESMGPATLHVIVGPERPYCGALPRTLAGDIPPSGPLGIVGTRLSERVRLIPLLRDRVVFELPAASGPEELDARAEALAAAVLEHAGKRAVDIYHAREGRDRLRRHTLALGTREPAHAPPETYSPLRTVLDHALREAVTGRIAIGLAEGLHSEVRARLVAADRARKACDRRLDELRSTWRSARQTAITSEILELAVAAEASR